MDRDKSKSSPAPEKHRETEPTRNQSTYVEHKNSRFTIFLVIFVIIMVVGAILAFTGYF